jgi:peptidoglycan-associated lipoprotein
MFKKASLVALTAASMILFAGCSSDGTKDSSSSLPPTPIDSGIRTSGTGNGGMGASSLGGTADLTQHSVYFEFDRSELKPEGQAVVSAWAKYMTSHPTAKVRLEGNTDERGTREYNVALGERRANSVSQSLQSLGVSPSQLTITSYGEERPVALGHDEASWSQNRRCDLVQQ